MIGSLTRRTRRTMFFLPLACAALYGCPTTEETLPDEEYADVLYEGGATDEALISLGSALDQKDPTSDPAHAPVLDSPAAGELPKSPIATFKWHFGAGAALVLPPGGTPDIAPRHLAGTGSSNGTSGLAPRRVAFDETGGRAPRRATVAASFNGLARGLGGIESAPRQPSWPAALARLLGPPRAANAHGDPVNGPATFLVFSTKSDAKLFRVFTDKTTFTPSQEAWDQLAAAGSEITLSLVGAELENNRIADGGGPWKGAVTTFTIAP